MVLRLYLIKKDMEIIRILSKFNTQKKCIAYLEKQRWNKKPTCPYCNSLRSSAKSKEQRYRCHDCSRSYSVLIGTVFESTKLPLTKWFVAICLIVNAKKGITSLQLARNIGVNKNTACYLQKRIKKAFENNDLLLIWITKIQNKKNTS